MAAAMQTRAMAGTTMLIASARYWAATSLPVTCSLVTVGSLLKNSTRPVSSSASRWSSATSSWVGTTNAAVSPRMRRGRAFTTANPPSRMSATVIGRSVMVGGASLASSRVADRSTTRPPGGAPAGTCSIGAGAG